MIAKASWGVMTFLAIGVAGYALTMTLAPALRIEFVVDMFNDHPLAAPAHLGGGGIALLLGAFQFSQRIRTRHLNWHRWTGRIYITAVGISGIAASNVALTTPGGPPAQFGFSMLAIAWLATTSMAYLRIRQGDIDRHRMWMVRSYALTLAAVSLRIYLPISQIKGIPFESAYPVIAWMCWVPNLMIAEWLVLPFMTWRDDH